MPGLQCRVGNVHMHTDVFAELAAFPGDGEYPFVSGATTTRSRKVWPPPKTKMPADAKSQVWTLALYSQDEADSPEKESQDGTNYPMRSRLISSQY
jgi:hypothetical protein